MKPVLILQNQSSDGPSHFGAWLARHNVPYRVFDTEAGEAYPASIAGHGALALLGGEMSANDDLPSLRQAERLILQAMDQDLPVIGHCLGGQLMARALGAEVHKSPEPEVGWHEIEFSTDPLAARWFGEAPRRTVFEWHEDAFGLPRGAVSLASSPACRHQAFAIGRHLAMQFHMELDAAKLAVWSASEDADYLAQQERHPSSVHGGERLRRDALLALPAQQQWADGVYRRWLFGE